MNEATKIIEQRRGMMDAAKAMKYEGFLGHPLTQAEMRLVPYVQYCAVNQQSIDRRRVDADEVALLKDWTLNEWCVCYPFNVPVAPTREFWQFMCDVLWDFYSHKLPSVDKQSKAGE